MDLEPAVADVYLDRAFAGLLAVVDRLGDDLVNERPHGPSTNSAAALVTHCCGVTEFWLGHVALARPSSRDRDAEFAARATVADLHALLERTRTRARADVARLHAGEGTDEGGRQFLPGGETSDAAVVLHVVEELYQHLGHLELTADALTG